MSMEFGNEDIYSSQGYTKVREFLALSVPRQAPRCIWKAVRPSVSNFLLFMGCFLLFMSIVMPLVFEQGWARGWGTSTGPSTMVWLMLGSNVLPGLAMIGWGLLVRRTIRNVLTQGALYKGKVKRVRPLPARINSRTFFNVSIQLDSPNGEIVRDSVDNYCVGLFLKARDESQDVEVLYQPNLLRRALLPLKMAAASRFD